MSKQPRKRFRGNGFRPELWKRILIYGALTLILATAETSFFARLSFLPATPDLILGAVVAIALLDSGQAAAVVGIGAGFLIDALGSTGVSLSPLFYLLIALTIRIWASKMLAGFLSWLALMLPALGMRAAFSCAEILILRGNYPFLQVLSQVLVPELICTLILCLPLYPIVSLCTIPLRRRGERALR